MVSLSGIRGLRLVIKILSMFRLVPKCKVVLLSESRVLEDEIEQIGKINKNLEDRLVALRKEYKDLEKRYQDSFLAEQEAKNLNKTLEQHARELHQSKEEAESAEEVANQQYLALQADITAATELSTKLKEALMKWMS